MEKALAKYVAAVAIRSSTQLTSLVPLLKGQCDPEEYKTYAIALASAAGHLNTELVNLVFSKYPEIKNEVEDEIKKYGLVL